MPRALTVPALLNPLENPGPNLVRGLLRTAYPGVSPPPGLLEAEVKQAGGNGLVIERLPFPVLSRYLPPPR
jgi:hypothetical protein